MYRKSTRQRVALMTLLAATATIVTLDFRENPGGPIRRVQEVAVSIVAPLQDGIARVFRPVGDFLNALGQIPELRKENAQLRAEREGLEEQQRRIQEILRENDRLRGLVGEKDWARGSKVGARVIGEGPSNQESTRFLDKGRDDGVREGMAVVSAEGLVGRVTSVAANYSKVILVIDPQHSVGARLTGTGETGVLTGRAEDDLRFEFIDPEIEVKIDETVVTSGYDCGIYPPGIPIGSVTHVEKSRDGLSKRASIRPFVPYGRLDFVLVLAETGPLPSDSRCGDLQPSRS